MLFTHYRGVLRSGIAIAVLATTPAFAQDTEGASTSAAAAAAVENPADIIVTARRAEKRLQDVPISITVFTGDQVQKRNIAIASDLAAYTPSLSVNTRFGDTRLRRGVELLRRMPG